MEEIIESLKDQIRLEAEIYYNSENNFNNADPTSGQRVYSTIQDIEQEIIKRLTQ